MSQLRARLVVALATLAVPVLGCGADEAVPPVIDAIVDGPFPDDASIDASAFCSTCGPTEICVQFFGGTCGEISLECQPRNAACPANACTPECMQWHCNHGEPNPFFRCDKGVCPGAAPGALICLGP